MPKDLTPATIAELLGLEPLPHEGGQFRNTLSTPDSSAIYYLLVSPDFSALHQLAETEVYHWYGGSALELTILQPAGGGQTVRLGPDLAAGERPQLVVPAGSIHGSRPTGEWSLVGTTMAPAFSWEGFRLADRKKLLRTHPEFAAEITALTR